MRNMGREKYKERLESKEFAQCQNCKYKFTTLKKIPQCGKCGSYKIKIIKIK